jgi:hypothetical protein
VNRVVNKPRTRKRMKCPKCPCKFATIDAFFAHWANTHWAEASTADMPFKWTPV